LKLKKLFVIGLMMFLGNNVFSQVYVNGVDINKTGAVYMQLTAVNTSIMGLKSKYQVYVDYGQKTKALKGYMITDADGNVIKFNSPMDALNYLYEHGWEYVDGYSEVISGKVRRVFMLKRKE